MKQIDDKERCERVIASEPINITAMRVMLPGETYEYEPSDCKGYICSDEPLPIRNIPTAPQGQWIENLTGKKFGYFEVIGLYAFYRRQMNGSRGKGRLGCSKARINLWVVKCKCGKYELRKRKSILNPNNVKDRCRYCQHELWIREKGRFY